MSSSIGQRRAVGIRSGFFVARRGPAVAWHVLLAAAVALSSGCRDGLGPTEGVAAVGFATHPGEMVVGQRFQLEPIPLDAAGRPLDIICVQEFATSDPSVVTVTDEGELTAVGPGEATITARLNTVPGTLVVRVIDEAAAGGSLTISPTSATTAVGHEVQFTAVFRDADGNVVSDVMIGWSSSDMAVATVDDNGRARGVAAGTAQIRAQARGLVAQATLTVTDVAAASVTVTPAQAGIGVGARVTFTATVRDADGNVLPGRQINWRTSDASVAAIERTDANTARVRGVSEGSATITATTEGVSGTATVTVTAAPSEVGSVTVEPDEATLEVDETLQLEVTVRDRNGAVMANAQVTFTSSAPEVATVSSTGRVRARAEGQATITVSSGGVSARSRITVEATPVASIEIRPAEPLVCVGQQLQLTAIVRSATGHILTDRQVIFESSAPAIAHVTAGGLLTGIAEGTAQITARSGGQSTTVQATVCLAAVASVELQPASATIAVGATLNLVVIVRDALGNILEGRPVTFTSSNIAVATVSANGTVRGLIPGTATITATVEGKSAVSIVTVVLP